MTALADPRAAVVVITDAPHCRFVLQRKDDTYPVARFRGTLACFGGQIEPGESADQAVRREITEEIADWPLRDAVLAALVEAGQTVTRLGHHITLYAAIVPDLDAHADRIVGLAPQAVCAEGLLEVLDRAALGGEKFAWDTDRLLHTYLHAVLGAPPW